MAQPKKFETGIIVDGGIAHSDGGSATEVWLSDGGRAPLPSGDSSPQFDLTDASTLAWDMATNPNGFLLATNAVGNTRTLPNSVLVGLLDGENFQLSFQQDATGSRTITFDTNFTVVGVFDLRPNQVSVVSILVQDGIGYAIISSWEGLPQNLSNVGTGEQILIGDTLKSLKAGANITLTGSATEILIEAAGGGGGATLNYGNVYVNSVIGNDTTGAINDPSKPFLTIAAAHAAIPAFVTGTPDHWTVIFQTNGTYDYPTSIPARNLSYVSDKRCTIRNTGTSAVSRSASTAGVYTHFKIDMPNSSWTFLNQGTTAINFRESSLTIIVDYFEFTGTTGDGILADGFVLMRMNRMKTNKNAFKYQSSADTHWYDTKGNGVDIEIGFLEYVGTGTAQAINIPYDYGPSVSNYRVIRRKVTIFNASIQAGWLLNGGECDWYIGDVEFIDGFTGALGSFSYGTNLIFMNSTFKGTQRQRSTLSNFGDPNSVPFPYFPAPCSISGCIQKVKYANEVFMQCYGFINVHNFAIIRAELTGAGVYPVLGFFNANNNTSTPIPHANFMNFQALEVINASVVEFSINISNTPDNGILMTFSGHNYLHTQVGFPCIVMENTSYAGTVRVLGKIHAQVAVGTSVTMTNTATVAYGL